MYEFHYKYIKSKFEAKLLFTDTDSLIYEIKTEDVYEDVFSLIFKLVIFSLMLFKSSKSALGEESFKPTFQFEKLVIFDCISKAFCNKTARAARDT